MNVSPTMRRFCSGSVTPRELRQEALGRVDVDELHLHVAAEGLDDALGLLAAHQAVVDEDARELVADGLVHERRRDGGVDAAGERADHAAVADLLADAVDAVGDEVAGRPVAAAAADLVEEVLDAPACRAACARPPGGTGCR